VQTGHPGLFRQSHNRCADARTWIARRALPTVPTYPCSQSRRRASRAVRSGRPVTAASPTLSTNGIRAGAGRVRHSRWCWPVGAGYGDRPRRTDVNRRNDMGGPYPVAAPGDICGACAIGLAGAHRDVHRRRSRRTTDRVVGLHHSETINQKSPGEDVMQCRCQNPPARHVRHGQGYAQSTDHRNRPRTRPNRPAARDTGTQELCIRLCATDRPPRCFSARSARVYAVFT